MIKLLLQSIEKYKNGGYKRVRDSNGKTTIVVYEVKNKDNVSFTRIDIFTREQ